MSSTDYNSLAEENLYLRQRLAKAKSILKNIDLYIRIDRAERIVNLQSDIQDFIQ